MAIPQTEVLIIVAGVEHSRLTLAPGEYILGRNVDCQIRVDADLVSRRHARLTLNADSALIEDLGSSNGTLINGKTVTVPTRVWPNQKIQIGAATIELRRLRKESAAGTPLAPTAEVVQRVLPEEFLREKKYDIGGIVAQGGMGAILDAKEATIGRTVAMKVMLETNSPDDLLRFINEAKVTGQLEHPSIVPVYELGVDGNGQVFYTMKFVKGITLKKVLELLALGTEATVKKYPLPVLLTVFQKVCDALAFAHSKGIIHRDLKPENIMLGDFGSVLVMDWGLAKRIGSADATVTSVQVSVSSGAGSTLAGSVMGTPTYMSPEQARGEVLDLDARSDVYALGAILYHLLALRGPVETTDPWEIVRKVGLGEVDPLTAPAKALGAKSKGAPVSHLPGGRIPESLAAVVRKAMAFDKAQRYPGVAELQADILAYQNGFVTSAEKAGLAKQILFAIKRNKIASAAAVLILVLTVGFMVKVIASERRAQRSLAELKATAPTFQAQALTLIETSPIADGAPEKALEHIEHAIALAPESADYLVTRGRILQTLLRLDDARKTFTEAQEVAPENPLAKANIAVCDAILRERMGDGAFGLSTLGKLAAALSAQGRNAEALYVTRGLAKIGPGQLAIWNAIVKKAGFQQTLRLEGDGTLSLSLANEKSLDQVSFLRGIPLNGLFISGTRVSDLSPLAGMPMRNLDLGESRVTDIAPLAGMPLERIVLPGAVKDISPLCGAPLEIMLINPINGRGPADYSVLRDMPLRQLGVGGTDFADLRLLEGKALTSLRIDSSKVTDLSPLRGMPLEMLEMAKLERARPHDFAFLAGNKDLRVLGAAANNQLIDLSSLRGVPVEELFLDDTGVADIRPLAGSNVTEINLNGTPFSAIEQLTAMHRLAKVSLERTAISDLGPLAASTIQQLRLADCTRIRSVKPLEKLSTLRTLVLPVTAREVGALRNHPTLQWLGYGGNVPQLSDAGRRTGELREFWKMHDLETKLRAAEPDGRLRPGRFPFMQSRFPRARQLGTKWFAFIPGKFTWPEAKQLATDLGGHLATVTNQADYDFTRSLANIGQGQVCWLGGQADKPNGTWHWVTGEPWNYTHWAKWKDGRTEPNYQDPQNKPKTVLAFRYDGAAFVSPPDICTVVADYENATCLLVEWED